MSSYQALYRAWRPEKFEDVCGQEAVTKTLKRQIVMGHVAHAYLFCGSRGTGKTTTAKVLSRAINCMDTQDGEPCGKCEACIQLKNESNMDILEIDAASNNGVDEVRALRDRIAYPPTIGKYKVYIIDEVHMLSTSAFNALLKTLEEPPAHAVFILATTEPQKLPATVLSRCQRYDFRRIAQDVIVDRMKVVLNGIGRSADDEALSEIARAAEGGMRDALSLLDMCLSYCTDDVKAPLVREVLGTTGREFMFDFAGAILAGNTALSMHLIDRAMRDGRDPQVFSREAAQHFRILLMALIVPNDLTSLAEITPEDAQRFCEQAKKFEQTRLMRAMDLFIRAEGDMKWVSNPRSILEMCAVRACFPAEGNSVEALTERIEMLEGKLKNGVQIVSSKPEAAPDASKAPSDPKAAPQKAPAAKPKGPKTQDEVMFDKAIEILSQNPSIRGSLRTAKFAGRDANVVFVSFDKNARIHMQALERKPQLLEAAFTESFGEKMTVNLKIDDGKEVSVKGVSGEALARTFEIFGRDMVEVTD
ncbi:MAG: DNA polymerase III subunit gamma/tau [Clostridiales bacterium]|nr:DNA polymerase III subunit gamma/tau [Clostridiales bacterium]